MKITIVTILATIAVLGWKMQDYRTGPPEPSSARAAVLDVDNPEWMPFESAIVQADTTGRPSMVFIYADWCQWCQKTFRETFTDEAVLAYLGDNFQVVKLNSDGVGPAIVMGEQVISEGQLAGVLGATGLPTYVFLDSEGQPISKTMGFYDAESVMRLLRTIAEG
jgi:thioredoxin-related protein